MQLFKTCAIQFAAYNLRKQLFFTKTETISPRDAHNQDNRGGMRSSAEFDFRRNLLTMYLIRICTARVNIFL